MPKATRCGTRAVTYSAAIESAAAADADPQGSDFAQRVGREAQRRRFEQATRRVVLGDGAPWIWNLAQELFPGATEIVDRFHVKQHLSEVAKAMSETARGRVFGCGPRPR